VSIFKAYDIRGKIPEELDEAMAQAIGRALVEFFRVDEIAVGHDCRLSNRIMFEALAEGITREGVNVVDLGLVTTPMLYFAVGFYGFPAGVMVTASHNPPEYNGFKLCQRGAQPVHDQDIQTIAAYATSLAPSITATRGTIRTQDVFEDYRAFILARAGGIKPMTVAVDTANCVAGYRLMALYGELPLSIIPLYLELDGRFPNHEPNPLKHETLKDLRDQVLKNRASLGIAFDGDGDRIGFLDETGEPVSGDFITLLVALRLIEESPENCRFVTDCRSSRVVQECLEERGAELAISRIGHSFIKKLMREKDAVFGGELSCHYYFRKHFYTESADLTALTIMQIISRRKKGLSELIQPYRRYVQSGEINFEAENKQEIVRLAEERYSKGSTRVSKLDGVSVYFPEWWFNLRPSNTEPLLRLNVEADTREIMEENRDRLIESIKNWSLKPSRR